MDIIRKYADAGDIVNLRYVFAGAFDADPTFEKYEADYQYCKGVLEDYREMTPLTQDESCWTEEYWYKVQRDLQKNLSDKRLKHMKKVARVVFKDKVARLEAERAAKEEARLNAERAAKEEARLNAERAAKEEARLNAERAAKKRPPASVAPNVPATRDSAASTPDASRPSATSVKPLSEYEQEMERREQRREREKQRTIEEINRTNAACEENQRRQSMDNQRLAEKLQKENTEGGDSSKKALGVAAAILLVLAAILLALFLKNK